MNLAAGDTAGAGSARLSGTATSFSQEMALCGADAEMQWRMRRGLPGPETSVAVA